jgi:hypothetical protein
MGEFMLQAIVSVPSRATSFDSPSCKESIATSASAGASAGVSAAQADETNINITKMVRNLILDMFFILSKSLMIIRILFV